jgi:hypothetical protein
MIGLGMEISINAINGVFVAWLMVSSWNSGVDSAPAAA